MFKIKDSEIKCDSYKKKEKEYKVQYAIAIQEKEEEGKVKLGRRGEKSSEEYELIKQRWQKKGAGEWTQIDVYGYFVKGVEANRKKEKERGLGCNP